MAEADLGVRDAKGEWQPANLPQPSPMWDRPVRTKVILKAIFGHDGILWPKNLVYMAIAVVAWVFLTPSLERTATFQVGWIAEIYLRNVALLVLIAGGLHLRLYIKRAQGKKFKYNGRWLAKKNRAFLFGNQTWDNMFWSLVSGAGIWTAYEAVTLWLYGNGWLPRVEWRTPAGIAYCSLMMLAVLFIRQMHFYWTHRWTHWKPLYKIAHYLHHRNVNIGPWSGHLDAPHRASALLLFGVLDPLRGRRPTRCTSVFHLMHLDRCSIRLASHFGLSDGLMIKDDKKRIRNGATYFHQLHHRYFECNYGNEGVPLDKWFGSFHDGSPEAHAAMRGRRKRLGFRDGQAQEKSAVREKTTATAG